MAVLSDKDIYKGKQNPFEDAAKGAEILIKEMEKILSLGKEMSKATIGDMNKNLKQSSSDLKKFTEDQSKLNQINKAASEIIKEKTRLETTLTKVTSEQSKVNERLKVQIQEQRKANKELARTQLGLIGSYEKLNKQLVAARKRAKDVAAQYGVTSKQFRTAAKDVLKLDSNIKKIDRSLGLSQRQVGNYGLAFKGALKSIAGLAVGFIGLRQGFRVLKDSVKTIADFEKAMDEVVAITGATNEEFERLEKNALKLGATTSKTAVEVAGLQKEFAKLGFSTEEILAATEATISLSIAAGSDLSDSAVIAASTIRGFGLSAAETQRVVDVMAKSFSSSALDIEKFKVSMSIAAPIAKAFGKDIEFTTAQLSILADAGIDASTSGTSLRNIFLELSKRGLTWEQGLQKINESTNKNVTALELFGKRGATAALVLAENTQKAGELEKAYDGALGAAEEMARIMEDNLIGDTKILTSAWDGFILSLNSGEGSITKVFRGLTQWLTEVVTNLKLMNTTYEELINNVKDDQLQELLKEDAKELNELTERFTEFNEPLVARQKAIDALVESYSKLIPKQQDELDLINKRIDALNESKKFESSNIKVIEEQLEILGKEKLSIEGNLRILDARINAFKKLGEVTKETNDIIEEGNNKEIENLKNLNKLLSTLKKEKLEIALTDNEALIRKENEIIAVQNQINVYNDLFKLLKEKPEDFKIDFGGDVDITDDSLSIFANIEQEITDELKAQLELRESLYNQHYDSLLGIAFNFAARKKVQDANLSAEEIQGILDKNQQQQEAVGELVSTLQNLYNQLLQSRLNQIQTEISAQNTAISEQEQLVNRELALLEAGSANEFDIEKEKLEKIQEERNKNLEEQKKLQKQQEQVDTLTQISSLATAVANIIAGYSEIPIVGVILGLAAAAAAVAGFVSIKSDSQSAATAEEGGVFTRKGAYIEKGNRHSQGGNRYNALETEQGEMHSILSRDATKKHGALFENLTNAANSGQLSNDELEMYKYSLNQLSTNNVVITNDYSRLLQEQKVTNQILRRNKIAVVKNKDIYFYSADGRLIGTNLP